jgi:hypothetical protein
MAVVPEPNLELGKSASEKGELGREGRWRWMCKRGECDEMR